MTYNCIKSQLSLENITAYTYPLYLLVPIQNLFLSKPNIFFSKFEGNFGNFCPPRKAPACRARLLG